MTPFPFFPTRQPPRPRSSSAFSPLLITRTPPPPLHQASPSSLTRQRVLASRAGFNGDDKEAPDAARRQPPLRTAAMLSPRPSLSPTQDPSNLPTGGGDPASPAPLSSSSVPLCPAFRRQLLTTSSLPSVGPHATRAHATHMPNRSANVACGKWMRGREGEEGRRGDMGSTGPTRVTHIG